MELKEQSSSVKKRFDPVPSEQFASTSNVPQYIIVDAGKKTPVKQVEIHPFVSVLDEETRNVTLEPVQQPQSSVRSRREAQLDQRNSINPRKPSKYAYQYVLPEQQGKEIKGESARKELISNKYPLQLLQDSRLIQKQRYLRRLFVCRAEKRPNISVNGDQKHDDANNYLNQTPTDLQMPQYTAQPHEGRFEFEFHNIELTSLFGRKQTVIVADNLHPPNEAVAIRIRTGLSGYTEWMNELQVYLLPGFKHLNILDFYGSEERRKKLPGEQQVPEEEMPTLNDGSKLRKIKYFIDKISEEERKRSRSIPKPIKIEYWLLNSYYDCMILKEYLKLYTLSWKQMIFISKGIIEGLNYLHENADYHDSFDKRRVMNGFVKSTEGAIKKVAFREQNTVIYMKPNYSLSIIHRNLNTSNVVLKLPDLTPCIWNFGQAYIHYPFQPINGSQFVDKETKELFLSSPYSAPEVLEEKGHLTLTAMKNIDMYACGIVFWELMSRTVLPILNQASYTEHWERSNPEPYYEPFEFEFGPNPNVSMLEHAVCKLRARPRIKNSWLVGKKTIRYVQTIEDLWDQDFDARLHTTTVADRLDNLCTTDRDERHDYSFKSSKAFNRQTMWPPKVNGGYAPPLPGKCGPNLVFENSTGS